MEKVISRFAITKPQKSGGGESAGEPMNEGGSEMEDPRMEAALSAMEGEFASVDENDPKAMGRMMRRMAELTGERIDGDMEEVVRKLEEGTDPEKLEDQLGGGSSEGEAGDPYGEMGGGMGGSTGAQAQAPKEAKFKYRQRRSAPFRDPALYDY